MANYSELIATINEQIKANGNQEITGPVLNAVLQAMVSALGEGYQFMGVATPDTNPGTPDGKKFYIANQPGVYTDFNNLTVLSGIAVLFYDTAWHVEQLLLVDSSCDVLSSNPVSNKAITAFLSQFAGVTEAVCDFTGSNPTLVDIPFNNGGLIELTLKNNGPSNSDIDVYTIFDGSTVKIADISLTNGDSSVFRFTAPSDDFSVRFILVSGRSIINARIASLTSIEKYEDLSERVILLESMIENKIDEQIDTTGSNPVLITFPFKAKIGDTLSVKLENIGNNSSTVSLRMRYSSTQNLASIISNEVVDNGGAITKTVQIDSDIESLTFSTVLNRSIYRLTVATDNKIQQIDNVLNGIDSLYTFDATGSNPTSLTVPRVIDKGETVHVNVENEGEASINTRFVLRFTGVNESDVYEVTDTYIQGGTSYTADWQATFNVIKMVLLVIEGRTILNVSISVTGVVDNMNNNNIAITNLEESPLSTLPSYIVKSLSYRPLGQLSKPYIILSTDDGAAGLATYTVPMVISKNVPCTFCIMKDSVVMKNETYRETVINAVKNNNCEIAVHGTGRWTNFTEKQLYNYFLSEIEYFNSLGVEVKSSACPEHYLSDIVKTVAGGTFGLMRAGYAGYDSGGNAGGVLNVYKYYSAGPRSNLFALPSHNVIDYDLNGHKEALSYIKENNYVCILYWHENDLNENQQQVLENLIDYAKGEGFDFITLSDLINLS